MVRVQRAFCSSRYDSVLVLASINSLGMEPGDEAILVNTLRFYLCVCPCVCDGCGRDCNEFAARVQNHHVRFSFSQKWSL